MGGGGGVEDFGGWRILGGGSHGFREEQKGDNHPSPTECKEVTGWGGGGEGKGGMSFMG